MRPRRGAQHGLFPELAISGLLLGDLAGRELLCRMPGRRQQLVRGAGDMWWYTAILIT